MECKSLNDVNKLRQLFYERQGNDAIGNECQIVDNIYLWQIYDEYAE